MLNDNQRTGIVTLVLTVVFSTIFISAVMSNNPLVINTASLVDENKALILVNGQDITILDLAYIATFVGVSGGLSYAIALVVVKRRGRKGDIGIW